MKRHAEGRWYPWIFVAAMVLVVGVNGVMVAFALGTWTGLETADHYRKGLAYNSNLEAARRQRDLGWTTAVTVNPGAETTALTARFRDRDGRPVTGLEVRAQVIRPTHEGHDRAAVLRHQGDGAYGASLRLPLSGQWEARVIAHGVDGDLQVTRRFIVP